MQEQIFKDLEKIGTKFSKIEIELGMPKNYLSRFKNPANKLPEKWIEPLAGFVKKHQKNTDPADEQSIKNAFDGQEITVPMMDEIAFNKPRPWIRSIEEYCGTAGITPEELIQQHSKKSTKATKPEAEKPSDDQKEAANFVARGMSNYDLERRKKKNGF